MLRTIESISQLRKPHGKSVNGNPHAEVCNYNIGVLLLCSVQNVLGSAASNDAMSDRESGSRMSIYALEITVNDFFLVEIPDTGNELSKQLASVPLFEITMSQYVVEEFPA